MERSKSRKGPIIDIDATLAEITSPTKGQRMKTSPIKSVQFAERSTVTPKQQGPVKVPANVNSIIADLNSKKSN